MILNEAVEAAAKAIFSAEQCDRLQALDIDGNWMGRLSDSDREEYRYLARAALSAALPAMQAPASCVEELEALPAGSIIRDIDGDPWKKREDGKWRGFHSLEESKTLFWGHMEIRPAILWGWVE